jgi:hypothetical protein
MKARELMEITILQSMTGRVRPRPVKNPEMVWAATWNITPRHTILK